MNGILFIALVAFVIISFVYFDHVRFNRQIDDFMETALELTAMYDIALETLKKGDADIEFQGERFYLFVEKGDYKSLVLQTELAMCEVEDKYDAIDKRYFEEMDGDLFSQIEEIRQSAQDVLYEIRLLKWKNGWK